MESKNELNEIDIKNHTCYYFDDIIKLENFDPDNILIDELIRSFYVLDSIKQIDLLELMMELNI